MNRKSNQKLVRVDQQSYDTLVRLKGLTDRTLTDLLHLAITLLEKLPEIDGKIFQLQVHCKIFHCQKCCGIAFRRVDTAKFQYKCVNCGQVYMGLGDMPPIEIEIK